jgi:hypothetical protein
MKFKEPCEFDVSLLHFMSFVSGLRLSEDEKRILEKKANHLWAEYEKHKMQFNQIAMY